MSTINIVRRRATHQFDNYSIFTNTENHLHLAFDCLSHKLLLVL